MSSVALIGPSGEVIWSRAQLAPGRASETCIALLEEALRQTGLLLKDCQMFVADVGPGSFTGVRVGLTLAKTFAWGVQCVCAGVDSFDLIIATDVAVVPSKKGEFFVRVPGMAPERVPTFPEGGTGYGAPEHDCFPEASRVSARIHALEPVDPMKLAPYYLAEPSISTPKRPLSRRPV